MEKTFTLTKHPEDITSPAFLAVMILSELKHGRNHAVRKNQVPPCNYYGREMQRPTHRFPVTIGSKRHRDAGRHLSRLWIFSTLFFGLTAGSLHADVTLFVAPEKTGSGSGQAAADAALWTAPEFWNTVAVTLKQEPVTVQFVPGVYNVRHNPASRKGTGLDITRPGHEKNLLTLQGAPDFTTIIQRDPKDPRDAGTANFATLMQIRHPRNLRITGLRFAGKPPIGYGLQLREAQDVAIDHCRFVDMPGVCYSATGVSGSTSRNVTWEDCYFENIGTGGTAHMIYNGNGASNITIRNCTFINVPGDFIRFRNGGRNMLIENCTFFMPEVKTPIDYPFISMPLFNSRDPHSTDPAMARRQFEYFANHITIRNNTFTRKSAPKAGGRAVVLMFHNSNFSPPGVELLFNREDIAKFQAMPDAEAREWLYRRTGIDIASVTLENNRVDHNTLDQVVYECWPNGKAPQRYPDAEYKNLFDLTRLVHRR